MQNGVKSFITHIYCRIKKRVKKLKKWGKVFHRAYSSSSRIELPPATQLKNTL